MAGGGGQFLREPCVRVAFGSKAKVQTLRVQSLRIRQIPAFSMAYNAMLQGVSAEARSTLLDLIGEQRDALVQLMALATDTTAEFIGQEFDLLQFAELIRVVLELNAEFLANPSPQPASKNNRPATAGEPVWDWQDSIQHLILAGHREPDILEYSFAKFQAYSQAAERQQNRNRALQLIDARCAQHYDEDGLRTHLQELARG